MRLVGLLLLPALAHAEDRSELFRRPGRGIDASMAAVAACVREAGVERVELSFDPAIRDLPAWCVSAAAHVGPMCEDAVVSTVARSQRAFRLEARGIAELQELVDGTATSGPASASDWRRDVAQRARSKRSAIVLISDRSPMELWQIERSCKQDCYDEQWHEEETGAALAAVGAALLVVAHEAPFGFESPTSTLRFLPWATRPICAGRFHQFAGVSLDPAVAASGPRDRGFHGGGHFVWPRFLGRLPTLEFLLPEGAEAECDVPSGSGYWSYLRACNVTGGRYVCFAEVGDPWLDPCPLGDRWKRLRPNWSTPAKAQNEALEKVPAVRRASDSMIELLRRTRGTFAAEVRGAVGIGADEALQRMTHGSKYEKDSLLLLPTLEEPRTVDGWSRLAKELGPAIKQHDELAAELGRCIAEPPTTATVVEERWLADLLLSRFLCDVAAFHLQAMELAIAELRGRAQVGDDLFDARTIELLRLSSLLDVPIEVARGEPDAPSVAQPTHSDDPTDASYRSRRDERVVTSSIDPALRPRLLKVIADAREIGERFGTGTPWYWVACYDAVVKFDFSTGPKPFDIKVHPVGDSSAPPDVTPPGARAGSSTGRSAPATTGGSGG